MEAVEDEADARVVGAADDLPGVAVVADVAAPGERLEADADAAGAGAVPELAEVGGGAVDAAERDRGGVRADEDQVGAELAHQVELALGAVEGAGALRLGHALEVAERLEEGEREAGVADHAADLGRGGVVGERSASKISTPSKPAAAMAASFSERSPLIETVAIEVFIGLSAHGAHAGGSCQDVVPT